MQTGGGHGEEKEKRKKKITTKYREGERYGGDASFNRFVFALHGARLVFYSLAGAMGDNQESHSKAALAQIRLHVRFLFYHTAEEKHL